MDSKVPARIDRATFDRVLQRAAELQAGTRDIGDGLTEDEIVALGSELGIPTVHLRQALIEERIRAPVESSTLLDRWYGTADIAAQRVVMGDESRLIPAITRWLDYHERFVVQRSTSGRATWEPMDAIAGTVRRLGAMFDPSRSRPYLTNVSLVAATVTQLEPGYSHVSLTANIGVRRRGTAMGAAALFGTGAVAAGAIILSGGVLAIAAAALATGGVASFAVTRSFHATIQRVTVGLERCLDALEKDAAEPASKRARLRSVGQVVREIGQEVRKALDE